MILGGGGWGDYFFDVVILSDGAGLFGSDSLFFCFVIVDRW